MVAYGLTMLPMPRLQRLLASSHSQYAVHIAELAASCPHQILFILLAPLSSSAITIVAPSLFAPSFRFLPRMLIICRSSRARRALTPPICGPGQLLPHPRALTVGLNSLHFHYDLSEPSYITKSHTTRMRYYTGTGL